MQVRMVEVRDMVWNVGFGLNRNGGVKVGKGKNFEGFLGSGRSEYEWV